jgi:hypothetical protein
VYDLYCMLRGSQRGVRMESRFRLGPLVDKDL